LPQITALKNITAFVKKINKYHGNLFIFLKESRLFNGTWEYKVENITATNYGLRE